MFSYLSPFKQLIFKNHTKQKEYNYDNTQNTIINNKNTSNNLWDEKEEVEGLPLNLQTFWGV
jgi:hypothetical protein